MLLGKVNPSGHLPFTWYTDDSQLPAITDYAIRPSQSAPGRTYMYYTGTPSFPFGHGLSYSSFRFSDLKVARRSVDASGTVTATAKVTNTGDVAGAATPQLYVTTPFASAAAERPAKRLLAFDRVEVQARQDRQGHFSAPASQLAFLDEDSET